MPANGSNERSHDGEVARASMAVEAAWASLGYEHADYIRVAFAEILNSGFKLRAWRLFASSWRLFAVLDARCV